MDRQWGISLSNALCLTREEVMTYLLVQLGFLFVGILLVWKYDLKMFKSWKHGVVTLLGIFLLVIIWDSLAVFYGWWSFSRLGMIGVNIGLLPLEEYTLAVIVPWFVIVFYKFVERVM